MYKQPTFSSSGRGTTWNVLKCLHCYNWRIISPIICRKKKMLLFFGSAESLLYSSGCRLVCLLEQHNNTTLSTIDQRLFSYVKSQSRMKSALARACLNSRDEPSTPEERRERGSITIKYNEEMSEEEVASGANCRAEEASISPHGDLDNSATREAIK